MVLNDSRNLCNPDFTVVDRQQDKDAEYQRDEQNPRCSCPPSSPHSLAAHLDHLRTALQGRRWHVARQMLAILNAAVNLCEAHGDFAVHYAVDGHAAEALCLDVAGDIRCDEVLSKNDDDDLLATHQCDAFADVEAVSCESDPSPKSLNEEEAFCNTTTPHSPLLTLIDILVGIVGTVALNTLNGPSTAASATGSEEEVMKSNLDELDDGRCEGDAVAFDDANADDAFYPTDAINEAAEAIHQHYHRHRARDGHKSWSKNMRKKMKRNQQRDQHHQQEEEGSGGVGEAKVAEYAIMPSTGGASVDRRTGTPLHWAVWARRFSLVRHLIAHHGADRTVKNHNGDAVLHCAIVYCAPNDLIRFLLSPPPAPSSTALSFSSPSSTFTPAAAPPSSSLFVGPAAFNHRGETPLLIAAARGRSCWSTVKLLCEMGADVSVTDFDYNCCSHLSATSSPMPLSSAVGMNALHYAVKGGAPVDVVRAIAGAGSNTDNTMSSSSEFCLSRSSLNRSPLNIDAFARGGSGLTALQLWFMRGRYHAEDANGLAVLSALVEGCGADVNLVSGNFHNRHLHRRQNVSSRCESADHDDDEEEKEESTIVIASEGRAGDTMTWGDQMTCLERALVFDYPLAVVRLLVEKGGASLHCDQPAAPGVSFPPTARPLPIRVRSILQRVHSFEVAQFMRVSFGYGVELFRDELRTQMMMATTQQSLGGVSTATADGSGSLPLSMTSLFQRNRNIGRKRTRVEEAEAFVDAMNSCACHIDTCDALNASSSSSCGFSSTSSL